MATAGIVLVLLTGFVGMVVIVGTLNAWVASVFWDWFIRPVFSVRPITALEAYGFALCIAYFQKRTKPEKQSPEQAWQNILYHVSGSVLLLGVGWLVHELILRFPG